MEIWKDIDGYNGIYQVSNYGNVYVKGKSIIRNNISYFLKPKYMKCRFDSDGYLIVGLTKNKKQYTHRVHRLVCEAFLENKLNKPQINHIDGNKSNNNINNLEWCTAAENVQHSFRLGLNKYSENNRVVISKKVIDIISNTIYSSIKEASIANNYKSTTLYDKLSGKVNNNTSLRYL